jgi:hypothetical protein
MVPPPEDVQDYMDMDTQRGIHTFLSLRDWSTVTTGVYQHPT